MNRKAFAVGLALLGLVAAAAPAAARNWVAVGMVHIPIRAYATPAAPQVGVIRGGSSLDLTGQCTGFLDLNTIAYMSGFRQKLVLRGRWCEVASPAHGWIFSGFMRPW
jgi:hypothetical protein